LNTRPDDPWTFVADTSAGDRPTSSAESRGFLGEEMLWTGQVPGFGAPAVSERSALSLSSVLSTVIVIATDVALLPCNVYRRRPNGDDRDRQHGHPVEELLTITPDGETTPFNWLQALVGHSALWGTGFGEIVRRGRGVPASLHLMPPDSTREHRSGGRLFWETAGSNGTRTAIPNEDVLRLAGFGHSGIVGYNLVRLLNSTIALGLQMQSFSLDYFLNGAFPGVAIETPMKLNPEAIQSLREGWDSWHQGAGKRFKTAVLQLGAKANVLSVNPEQSQLIEGRRFQVNDSVRPWRVPPHKYGDYSQAHLANIEASNLDYLQTALMPWLRAFCDEANLKLFSTAERRAGYYVEFNVNALLRGDIKSRFESYGSALDRGWMNRNEVRARENMNAIPEAEGGFKHLVGLNQTTLAQVGEVETPDDPATELDDDEPATEPDNGEDES
jgi:HK97 family phage portal protein